MYFSISGQREEAAVRFLGDEAHRVFDAGAIVPAAIEYDDLARGGKAFDVALNEHLAFSRSGKAPAGAFYPSLNR